MVKGFILYKNEKIPFVIEKYRMELFTDDEILNCNSEKILPAVIIRSSRWMKQRVTE
jgi:hypothetical protein